MARIQNWAVIWFSPDGSVGIDTGPLVPKKIPYQFKIQSRTVSTTCKSSHHPHNVYRQSMTGSRSKTYVKLKNLRCKPCNRGNKRARCIVWKEKIWRNEWRAIAISKQHLIEAFSHRRGSCVCMSKSVSTSPSIEIFVATYSILVLCAAFEGGLLFTSEDAVHEVKRDAEGPNRAMIHAIRPALDTLLFPSCGTVYRALRKARSALRSLYEKR